MVLEHMVLSNILLYPLLQKCGIEQLLNHGAKFSISKEGLNRNHHKFKLYLQTGHLPSGCAECYILPSMSVQINKGYTILLSWVQDQDKTKTRQSLSWKTKTKPRQDKLCLGKTKTKPRQDVSWFCLVLDPRQILFVLSWSCLGLEMMEISCLVLGCLGFLVFRENP